MSIITAVAGVVVKELYRRKDFYVLFVLTALITVIMGSVTLFHDSQIGRYLKEICLLLIWICSLVIAIRARMLTPINSAGATPIMAARERFTRRTRSD